MTSMITRQSHASPVKRWLGVSAMFALVSSPAWTMDTDIFTSNSTSGAPNVLIILDNTPNWSRQDEHFPVMTQGQAEANAIQSMLPALKGNINVGLMEFQTGGSITNDDGGYIRQAIVPMGLAQGPAAVANQSAFSVKLATIASNVTTPGEKTVGQAAPYGDLMYDAYNYFSGLAPFTASADVDATRADANGYTSLYTQFKSPVSSADICASNYIIFIGNPPANGPRPDTAANAAALTAVGGPFTQLPLPPYATTTTNVSTPLGYSNSCFTTAPTSTPTDYASLCPPASSTYDSCSYSSSDFRNTMNACPAGQSRYLVIATTPSTSSSGTPVVTTSTNTGTSACYASSSAASSDTGGMTCPANTTTTSGNTITTTSYSCSYALTSTTPASTCSPTVVGPATGSSTTSTATTTACYSGISTGNNKWSNSTDYAGLTCPSSTSSTSGNTTTSTTYTCGSYSGAAGSSSGCSSGEHVVVSLTATPHVTTTTTTYQYGITQTVTKTVTTSTSTGSTQSTLGNTSLCYSSAPSGTPTDYTCPSGATCSYGAATSAAICPAGNVYQVLGNVATIVEAPTGGAAVTDTATYNADEWARFMNTQGFSVAGTTTPATAKTYTIDVYGVKPDAVQSSLLSNMAKYGGGKYFTATNEAAIVAALTTIFSEITAANSTFASVALPISASQRTQNSNQVYIGMFRPDQQSLPRWMGNLKRYELGSVGGGTNLVDTALSPAVSTSSGFITPCAQSWWTTDSNNYWATVDPITGTVTPRIFFTSQTTPGLAWTTQGDDTSLAKGGCLNQPAYSDLPDGPVVEKGGVAERMRIATSRTVKTLSGSTLEDFNTTNVTSLSSNATINQNIVKFILGQDVTGEINSTPSTSNRPSIHGAVIHSRPLPVDYGGTTGVKVFYGSNDGTFRAVDAATGNEDWAFVPPETYPYLQRALDNYPPVQTPSPTPPGQTAAPGTPKEFFVDGSTGLYQSGIGSSSKTWIYPAMRRGGRVVYAFDVTTPTTPSFKWKAGCPNLGNDTGCSTGMAGIGQTWSTPNLAFLPGYKTSVPVVIVGGGYDTCEDLDGDPDSACSATPKGAGVYVLDADTGAVIASFATLRSVAADIALADANLDGTVDFAYAADTGGNIYRINFSDPGTFAPLPPGSWTITKVAYTNGGKRKFLFTPALVAINNQVYMAIGTGDREHPTALSYPFTHPVLNRAYVYRDDLTITNSANAYNLDSLNNITATNTCTAAGVAPGSASKGWFLDLNANGVGEQVVTSALISGGIVFFSTNRPIPAAVCGNTLGEARGYALNLLNGSGAISASSGLCGGTRSAIFVGGGLAPSPVAGVVTVNGVTQHVVVGGADLGGGTSTSIGGQQLIPPITSKRSRLYWHMNTDTK